MRLIALATLAALVTLVVGGAAYSGLSSNTIAPTATIEGKHVHAIGLITCTAGERIVLEMTLTERVTGALARGRTHGVCTGSAQEFPVKAKTRGKARFVPGQAEACALALTRTKASVTDAHQWCREGGVTLTRS